MKKLLLGLLILMLVLVLLPPFLPGYWLRVLTIVAINAVVVLSFRLITTMGGWSFAHVVMMGVGGYTTGFLTTKFFAWPFWVTWPLGGLAAALFASLISYPCLRTKGFYFFLSSFAAGEAMRQAWIRFREPFGSHDGIAPIIRPDLLGQVATQTQYYYVVLAIAILCIFILYWLDRSRIGDTVKAIRSNAELCESVGVNVWGYKALAFVVGSFFAGIAGVLFAHYNTIVTPADFSMPYMFRIVAFAIVGGVATFGGPLVGLMVLTVVTELSRAIPAWLPFIYGVIIIATLLFLPGGLGSLPKRIRSRGGLATRE